MSLCISVCLFVCWPGLVAGCVQSPGSGGIPGPLSWRGGGNAHSGWLWSNTPGWSEPQPHPTHPSDLQPQTRGISIKACDNYYIHENTQRKQWIIYSVQYAAAAVPQGHAHFLVRLVPQSSGPSHREEQLKAASILPVQKYPAASFSLFLLFCLKRNISMINIFNYFIFTCWIIECLQPCSFLQSTTSTCASRCFLASSQRALDRVLFPLPCEDAAT